MGNRAIQIESLLAGLLDNNGNPLAAGKVYTYAAGTSTPKTTWIDAGKTTPATNPVILDGVGCAEVYADGDYKIVVKTSADVLVATHDGVKYRSPTSNVLTKISNYTATHDDDVILANAASGAITITLPSATTAVYPIIVKKIDSTANAVTIAASGGQTIDGSATIDIAVQNGTATLYSDGSQWRGATTTITAGDSDKLDGYHAANTSGAVPINNGTVNTNLNSDYLDGQHGSFYQNADNLNAGTVPLARIPATLTGKDADTVDGSHGSVLSPPGSVTAFAGSTAPTGWLECDGAAVSRTTYATLFSVIGTTYGAGDSSTTFNLPDLRGEFIRGWAHSRSVDTGRALGSNQSDDLKSHTHSIDLIRGQWNSNASSATDEGVYGTGTTGATGGTETRPRNVAMMYIIKH